MSSDKQATWGGRFSGEADELMLRFSESVSFDARLAPYDVDYKGVISYGPLATLIGWVAQAVLTSCEWS